MADDIFSQMLELFNQPGPVNWKLAKEIAGQLAGERQPVDPWLADEYIELGRLAQLQIQTASPLRPPDALDVVPVDRFGWVSHHLKSLSYLAEPLGEAYAGMGSSFGAEAGMGAPEQMAQFLRPLGSALLGMQMGSTIGFLAHRSLGQFDIGLPVQPPPTRAVIVDNVEAFASDNDLDPRQARLWISMRNVVHDSAFNQPWLYQHLVDLIDAYASSMQVNATDLMGKLQGMADPTQLQSMMEESSEMAGLISPTGEDDKRDAVRSLIGFVSGYGGYVLDSAATNLIPDLPAIRLAHERKRSEPQQPDQAITTMLGLDVTNELHEMGRSFCTEVERRWGADALEQVWSDAVHLPKYDELSDPVAWAARVLLPEF